VIHLRPLVLAPILLLIAACASVADAPVSDLIVVTAGNGAPSSDLGAASGDTLQRAGVLISGASVGGSKTTPLVLAGTGCTVFDPTSVVITFVVNGALDSDASFDVFTSWAYDGTGFVGSDPVTVHVPGGPAGPGQVDPVAVTISSSLARGGIGTAELSVTPFGIVTNGDDVVGHQLNVAGRSAATIFVAFSSCDVANTPPTITVPGDIEVVATSIAGAAIPFTVTATDREDGDLTDRVECTAEAGHTFDIGLHPVTCSVTDSGGLSVSASFGVIVTLDVDASCGFHAPLRMAAPYSSHRLGSTMPHTMCTPRYRDGSFANDLAAGLHFALHRRPHGTALADPEAIEVTAAGSTAWRWEPTTATYAFNLKSDRTWPTGDFESIVSYNGILIARTFFVLR
jgi:hypothetical protein